MRLHYTKEKNEIVADIISGTCNTTREQILGESAIFLGRKCGK